MPEAALFPRTAWTLVRAVQAGGDAGAAHAALESLCEIYWRPVAKYLRALGCGDAEDVAQEFFMSFLRTGGFEKADPERARLRTFIKHAAGNFLWNHRRHAAAQRRGGGQENIPLEDALEIPSPQRGEAERAYDREWAQTVFRRALQSLGDGYRSRGKGAFFDTIKYGLLRQGGVADAPEVAAKLGISEAQVRLAVHRARQRLADALRREVAAVVDGEGEVEAELRYLTGLLATGG